MHLKLVLVCALLATAAMPALAAEKMLSGGMMSGGSMMMGKSDAMMLKPGEAVVVMPNGEVMMMPAMKADAAMMKMAAPMDKCMVLMMGADHKMHMLEDMKMAGGKTLCGDAMGMMKH
jgi:hypothetical protein